MIKTKVAFLKGRLLLNQPEQSEKFSKSLIGWKKAGPSKQPLLFWSCKQAISVLMYFLQIKSEVFVSKYNCCSKKSTQHAKDIYLYIDPTTQSRDFWFDWLSR